MRKGHINQMVRQLCTSSAKWFQRINFNFPFIFNSNHERVLVSSQDLVVVTEKISLRKEEECQRTNRESLPNAAIEIHELQELIRYSKKLCQKLFTVVKLFLSILVDANLLYLITIEPSQTYKIEINALQCRVF